MIIYRHETSWIAHTPAKLNFFFEVHGKRHDGFHEITSVAVPIRLMDRLKLEPTEDGLIDFDCLGGGEDIPSDETNIVVKALQLVKQRFNVKQGASVCLHKRIPSQAGLGGGSSDAAAAIKLARRAWKLDVTDKELIPLAAEIGSDCPIFFYKTPSLSRGRGEIIEPLNVAATSVLPLWFVILKPAEGLSTAKVYAECMPMHDGNERNPAELITALQDGDAEKIGRCLFNRLEAPARKLWSRFDEIEQRLRRLDCAAVRMSGSGTAFYGLCRDQQHAKNVAAELKTDPQTGADRGSEHESSVFVVSSTDI
jgi:4-diphosphocytidyl-2-C-methyl-D-erythritol kinase